MESVLWPAAYLRDSLHGSSLILCTVQNLLGAPLLAFHWESDQAMAAPYHSLFLDPAAVQLEQCLSSEQSYDCCHNPKPRPGWGWRSPRFGFVLTFGPCSQHRAAHGKIQLQALEQPCWAFTDSTCNSATCWRHTQTSVSVQINHATFSAFRTTNWNRSTLQFCLSGTSFLPVSVFKIPPVLTWNTLVAHYEASSLDDKQLNLHFCYFTCTFKISSCFITRGIEVLRQQHICGNLLPYQPRSLWWWLDAYRTTGQMQKEIQKYCN